MLHEIFERVSFLCQIWMSESIRNYRITVRVVISRETRVPGLSLSRLTDDLHPTTYRGPDEALTMTAVNA